MARERERSKDAERTDGAGEATLHASLERVSVAAPEAPSQSQASQAGAPRDLGRPQPVNAPLAAGDRPRDTGPSR